MGLTVDSALACERELIVVVVDDDAEALSTIGSDLMDRKDGGPEISVSFVQGSSSLPIAIFKLFLG